MKEELPKYKSIEELIEECEALLTINSIRPDESAANQSSIFFKVQRMIASESEVLDFYTTKLNNVELHLRRFYSNRFPVQVYKERPLKYPAENAKELDLCIKTDEMYIDVEKAVRLSKKRLEFLESVLWRIKERGNEIRSVIEWKKYIEAGL